MKLKTFGGVRLEGSDFRRPKALLLLSYLALEGSQERRHLAELFWRSHENALGNLAMTLSRLKEALPGALELSDLFAKTHIEADFLHLNKAYEAKDWQQVETLYQGTFLEGLNSSAYGVEIEEWVFKNREEFANLCRHALIELAEESARRGNFAEAARRAAKAYQLRYAPEPEAEDLKRLYPILRADLHPDAKDVQKEARAYGVDLSLDQEDAQAQLTESQRRRLALVNLPSFTTNFIGRSDELKQVADDLRKPEWRLLTLLAQGGMGKTRLAIEVARTLAKHFADGVCFASFVSVSADEQIPFALGQALNYTFFGADSPKAQLVRFLKDKELLLVLDNVEHLSGMAELINDLLLATTRLKILATSRESLRLQSERIIELKGLTYSAVATASDDAVRVFLQTAQHRQPSLDLNQETASDMTKLCQLVGGMPLALELSASWLRTLSLKRLVAEVEKGMDLLQTSARDLPNRHKSMRAIFDYSWQRLSPEEQTTMRRLAVFQGGFDLEAAKAITGTSLATLANLIDKSFLSTAEPDRYRRHPLVIQYAQEKLSEHPEEHQRMEERHGHYFLALIRELSPKLRGLERKTILKRLELDFTNIKAAWTWAIKAHDKREIETSVEALSETLSNHNQEIIDLIHQAIAIFDEGNKNDHLGLSKLYVRQAKHYMWFDKPDHEIEIATKGRNFAKASKNKRWLALGSLLSEYAKRYVSPLQTPSPYEAIIPLIRESGTPNDVADYHLCKYLYVRNHYSFAEVESYFRQVIAELRELKDFVSLSGIQVMHGAFLAYNHYYEQGRQLLLETLKLNQELDIINYFNGLYSELGYAAFKLGYNAEASAYFGKAISVALQTGALPNKTKALSYLSRMATQHNEQAKALDYLKEIDLGTAASFVLEALIAFAEYEIRFGNTSVGLEILYVVLNHAYTEPRDRTQATDLLDELQKELPETMFQKAQTSAKGLELENVIDQLKHFQNTLS